jgi:hypothetical protein
MGLHLQMPRDKRPPWNERSEVEQADPEEGRPPANTNLGSLKLAYILY